MSSEEMIVFSVGLKLITLKGTSEQVASAKALVEEKVAEEDEMQAKIKSSVVQRYHAILISIKSFFT